MSNAIERIKGYCCEVTKEQWEELVRVADDAGLNVWRKSRMDVHFLTPRHVIVDSEDFDILLSYGVEGREIIPFPDFLAKLRGDEEWQPKAGEMVEVSRNGEVWITREFIAKSKNRFIVWSKADDAVDFTLCRPSQAIPTITRAEAEQQLGKRIID